MKFWSCLYFLFLFGIVFFSCQPQKRIAHVTSIPVPVLPVDTLVVQKYFVTSQGDTLASLDEEVDIAIHRVLQDTVTIIGVGDIMMGTNFPEKRYLPSNLGRDLWSYVKDTLSMADVTFGNLEGVILNEGGTQKKCKNPKTCYLFRTPKAYLGNLTDAGFDVMSLANNHAGDFGKEGRASTMKALDSLKINYAGLLSKPYTIFKRNGMRYGIAAFSPNKGTASIHNPARAVEIVALLDSLADIVIVSFHGGAEGSKHEHVPRKHEMFYGEDRGDVYDFSRKMIDAGADVVFGHGPHVTRAIDEYKSRFIIYSLGNFCTYGRFNLRGVNGVAPIVKVSLDSEGKFLSGEVIPVIQLGAGGPRIDTKKRAIKKIAELTKKDFPESNLKIDDSGFITYINR